MLCMFKVHEVIGVIPLSDLSSKEATLMLVSVEEIILMLSSIHLQCVVVQATLTRLCKLVNGRQHKRAPYSCL